MKMYQIFRTDRVTTGAILEFNPNIYKEKNVDKNMECNIFASDILD